MDPEGTRARLQHTVKAVVRKGERYYVAECLDVAVVTQGRTLDETLANLQEAVALHLEGEDPADFGLVAHPTILVTMELEPASAQT
ncbi:MAG: type II toxin-antitoxin system HicB family antitoxin [Chloroflexi bacterium]|nr:type II toxin-antitoxin system HicB family antitoxin [Chloroflexota bacterium]